MKSKIFKYIGILFLIGIIIFIISLIVSKNVENNSNQNSLTGDVKYKITNLRMGITDFDTMNPLKTSNKEIINIDKIVYESLVKITQDYNIDMCLAKECSKISDTSYIVILNEKAKWQDGTNVVAKDVEFTINTLKEGRSVYSSNVDDISNVEIIDEVTLRINLLRPVSFFEYNLTFPIVSSKEYENKNFYETDIIPMGTGYLAITKIEDNSIVLDRNRLWWREEETALESINIKIYSSMGELYNSFKLGNIDIFSTTNYNLEEYIGTMGYTKQEVKGRQYDYLAFNMNNEVLSKNEVRQAIACAIDKNQLVTEVFGNSYCVADFPLDYGSYLNYDNSVSSGYNPDKVKTILEEKGWSYQNNKWVKTLSGNTRSLQFNLVVDSSNSQRVDVCENIKNQLEKVGIIVNINKVSNSTYKRILDSKNYDLILTGVYNGVSPNLESFFGEGNLQNYKNDEINNIFEEIKNTNDKNVLIEKYKQIIQIYNNDHPFIGLYRNKIVVVKSQNLVGEVTSNNYFTYYNINKWYRI